MIINPRRVIEQGWVKFPSWMTEEQKEKCVQPNALDITLDKVFMLTEDVPFILTEDLKQMRSSYEQYPGYLPNVIQSTFTIPENSVVDCNSDFYVTVPAGYSAWLIVRSSLNRNGLFITSGWYDQGFQGSVGFALHNRGPQAFIGYHTRIGQLIFTSAEDSNIMYAGHYNTNQGQHWSEKA